MGQTIATELGRFNYNSDSQIQTAKIVHIRSLLFDRL